MASFSVLTGAFTALQWSVVSIVGEEALSTLSSFHITVTTRREAISEAARDGGLEPYELALVGQQVHFGIDEEHSTRYGIVAAVRALGTHDQGGVAHARILLEVVPRAWLLTQRRNSRIFQHWYVHQIVSQVLADSGVNCRWALSGSYRKRVFCTQYDETDYEFVTRILAEEGILFFFEHDDKFAGGPVPLYLATPSTLTSDMSAISGALGGLGALGTGVGGLGDNKALDVMNFGGHAADLASSAFAPPLPDEEADDLRPFPPGSAGPGGRGDVFVFTDDSSGYGFTTQDDHDNRILTLTLRDDANLEHDRRYLSEFQPLQRIRAQTATVRDFDFRRPLLLLEATSGANALTPGLEPPPSTVAGAAPLDVYMHHGEYETPEVDPQLAQTVLSQYRSDALVMRGKGVSPRLKAGFLFQLHNQSPAPVAEGSYAVVRVRHEWHTRLAVGNEASDKEGAQLDQVIDGCARAIHEAMLEREPIAEAAIRQIIQAGLGKKPPTHRTYANRFDCVPFKIVFRPPRPPRKVRNVTESATVVGPIGIPSSSFAPDDPTNPLTQPSANEVYVDQYGRVKIQFHWDRDGKLNENSSCWVRVAQAWAGPGFGFQFFPRIGMEVLVTFLAGDPDRPVIIGSLYNATHNTPEKLPYRATRSTLRTQTSPGGGGFNELSFEDMKGVERVHIHAQKDLEEVVNDTHALTVGNNQKVMVTALQEVSVGGNQVTGVGQNRSTIVGGDQREHVSGNRTSVVVRNETSYVNGNRLDSTDGVAVKSVKTDEVTVIEGSRDLTVRGTSLTHIGGTDQGTPSSAITFVQGSSILTATQRILMKAEKAGGDGSSSSIRLECGDSFIEIHADKITLSSKTIEVLGGDSTHFKGKESEIKLSSDGAAMTGQPVSIQNGKGTGVQLDGGSATMTAGSTATVQGGKVALQSGGGGGGSPDSAPPSSQNAPNLKLVFTHLALSPQTGIASTPYRVVVEDQIYEGTTDGTGMLQVYVPSGAKVVHVVLWANTTYPALYPLGPLVWLVHIVDSMFDATGNKGARLRLRNLAFDPGTVITSDDLDDATSGAVMEFQIAEDLPPTGLLDATTAQKLSDTYGTGS